MSLRFFTQCFATPLFSILFLCLSARAEEKTSVVAPFDISVVRSALNVSKTAPSSYDDSGQVAIILKVTLPVSSTVSGSFEMQPIVLPVDSAMPKPSFQAYSFYGAGMQGVLFYSEKDGSVEYSLASAIGTTTATTVGAPRGNILISEHSNDHRGFKCSTEGLPKEVALQPTPSAARRGSSTDLVHLTSTPFTGELREYRLAVNYDSAMLNLPGNTPEGIRDAIRKLVIRANQLILVPEFGIRLKLVYIGEVTPTKEDLVNDDTSRNFNHNQLKINLGINSFDLGILILGESWELSNLIFALGNAERNGACDNNIKGKAVIIVNSIYNTFLSVRDVVSVFSHEVGHLFNAYHTYETCDGLLSNQSIDEPVEPSDGNSLMSYYGGCNNDTQIPYDSVSVLEATSLSRNNYSSSKAREEPLCGKVVQSFRPNGFAIEYIPVVPSRTQFSFLLPNPKTVGRFWYTVDSDDTLLPNQVASLTIKGRFVPKSSRFLSERSASASSKYTRLDFAWGLDRFRDFPIGNGLSNESLLCKQTSRKIQELGCEVDKPIEERNFSISLLDGSGRIDEIQDVPLTFQGAPFGFADNYLKDTTWTAKKEPTIKWQVGGGSIAKTVDIFWVKSPSKDVFGEFPETLGQKDLDYFVLASSTANDGTENIIAPDVEGAGFLLLVPSKVDGKPIYLFWSRSHDAIISKCATGSKGGLGCEAPTPTPQSTPSPMPSPSISPQPSPTGTPSGAPSPTATSTPGIIATSTPSPAPSPTPGNGCTPLPGEYYCLMQSADGGGLNLDFIESTPPGPRCTESNNWQTSCDQISYFCQVQHQTTPPTGIISGVINDPNSNGLANPECCYSYAPNSPNDCTAAIIKFTCLSCSATHQEY